MHTATDGTTAAEDVSGSETDEADAGVHSEKLSWEMDSSRPPPEALPEYEEFEPAGAAGGPSSFEPLEPAVRGVGAIPTSNDEVVVVVEDEEEETEC